MNEQKRTKCDKMRQNNTKKVAKALWCKDLRWMPWILSQRITNRLTTDSKEQIRSDEITITSMPALDKCNFVLNI